MQRSYERKRAHGPSPELWYLRSRNHVRFLSEIINIDLHDFSESGIRVKYQRAGVMNVRKLPI